MHVTGIAVDWHHHLPTGKTHLSEALRRKRAVGHEAHLVSVGKRVGDDGTPLRMSHAQHLDNLNHKLQAELEPEVESKADGVSLAWKDVGFSLPATKGCPPLRPGRHARTVLSPCSGYVAPGAMLAIMGPSGSGKSTLLDILAGTKTARFDGQVYIDGHDAGSGLSPVAAYIPQADIT